MISTLTLNSSESTIRPVARNNLDYKIEFRYK